MAKESQRVSVDMGDSAAGRRSPARTETTQRAPSALAQMEREMQRMFEAFSPRRWMRPWQWEIPELRLPFEEGMPKVDVIDRDNEILVRAELPGVEKQDIDVALGDGTVTIKAVAQKESTHETGEYFRRELASGEVSRTVALPGTVEEKGVKAKFDNGILEVILPKAEKARRRQISIQ